MVDADVLYSIEIVEAAEGKSGKLLSLSNRNFILLNLLNVLPHLDIDIYAYFAIN